MAAILADLGRPAFESITGEIMPTLGEINEAISHLEGWAKPQKVKTSLIWGLAKATIYPVPKGEWERARWTGTFRADGCAAQVSPSSSERGTVRHDGVFQ